MSPKQPLPREIEFRLIGDYAAAGLPVGIENLSVGQRNANLQLKCAAREILIGALNP